MFTFLAKSLLGIKSKRMIKCTLRRLVGSCLSSCSVPIKNTGNIFLIFPLGVALVKVLIVHKFLLLTRKFFTVLFTTAEKKKKYGQCLKSAHFRSIKLTIFFAVYNVNGQKTRHRKHFQQFKVMAKS